MTTSIVIKQVMVSDSKHPEKVKSTLQAVFIMIISNAQALNGQIAIFLKSKCRLKSDKQNFFLRRKCDIIHLYCDLLF